MAADGPIYNRRLSAITRPHGTIYVRHLHIDRAVGDSALAACAELYGRVQRKLFAAFAAGISPASLKSLYLQRYGIPARMFNGVRVSLEGKVSSVRETMALRRDSLERRIARAEREIDKAVKGGRWAQVHHKRRRLANLRFRLAGLEADIAAGRVRLCFGSKRLWRKQYELHANGYGSHEEWLSDWRFSCRTRRRHLELDETRLPAGVD